MLGQTLGSYKVLSKLGEGGMGVVYAAEHSLIGRKAAIKVLLPQFTGNRDLVDRFFNEAKAATAIHHPGIVEVYDFGTLEDGSAFMVMEFLQGESLEARIKRLGRLSIREASAITKHIASALAAAHAQGIVHRDLKPDNVFLVADPDIEGGERVKILDFGIAKLAESQRVDGAMRTRTGMVMGTPSYMSPEQCRGAGGVDTRSDIYALGCVFFHLLTGRPPFTGDGFGQILGAHQFVDPPSAASLVPSIPPELDAFIARTLAKEPDQRPQTMQEVAAAVADYGSLGSGRASAALQATAVPESAAGAMQATAYGDAAVGVPPPAAPSEPPASGEAAVATAEVADPPPPQTEIVRDDGGGGKKAPWLAIAAVAGVVTAGGVAYVVAGSGGSSDDDRGAAPAEPAADAAVATPAPAPDAAPAPAPRPRPPTGMVLVSGGTFEMGSTSEEIAAAYQWCRSLAGDECRKEVYEREQPVRTVEVSPFFLDIGEVTNEAFAGWLGEAAEVEVGDNGMITMGGDLVAMAHPEHGGIAHEDGAIAAKPDRARLPVVLVTWTGARAYCEARGATLPSEAQWAIAARGTERRRFPWGAEEPECDKMTFGRAPGGPCEDAGAGATELGAARNDVTPDGVRDLGGNVAEWVRDVFYDRYPACEAPCRDPVVEAPSGADAEMRVIRGGFAQGLAEVTRAAGRSRQAENALGVNIGFRCAKAIEP